MKIETREYAICESMFNFKSTTYIPVDMIIEMLKSPNKGGWINIVTPIFMATSPNADAEKGNLHHLVEKSDNLLHFFSEPISTWSWKMDDKQRKFLNYPETMEIEWEKFQGTELETLRNYFLDNKNDPHIKSVGTTANTAGW